MASRDGANAPGDAEPVRLEWAEVDAPTFDVVESVASVTGRDALELPPLNDAVDGDALEALAAVGDRADLRISFTYADTSVVVDCGEAIEVRPDAA